MFERALDRGLEGPWKDIGVSKCHDGGLVCEEAAEHVGRTYVKRAERERATLEKDGDWSSNA